MRRDSQGRFTSDLRTADDYRSAVERGDVSRDYGLRIARGLERSGTQQATPEIRAFLRGHRGEFEGRLDRASEDVDRQTSYFVDQVEERLGFSREDILDNDDFREAFESAFGYDPVDGPPADFDPVGQGFHESRGFFYENPKAYAEFLSDWLDYDHDEIDYWLGYEDTA